MLEDSDSPLLRLKIPELHVLEDSFACKICYESLKGPVLLACGHSFCSSCIRQNIDFRTSVNQQPVCPLCRSPTDPSELRPSIQLREASEAIRALRPALTRLLNAAYQLSMPSPQKADIRKSKSTIQHVATLPPSASKMMPPLLQASTSSRKRQRKDGGKDSSSPRIVLSQIDISDNILKQPPSPSRPIGSKDRHGQGEPREVIACFSDSDDDRADKAIDCSKGEGSKYRRSYRQIDRMEINNEGMAKDGPGKQGIPGKRCVPVSSAPVKTALHEGSDSDYIPDESELNDVNSPKRSVDNEEEVEELQGVSISGQSSRKRRDNLAQDQSMLSGTQNQEVGDDALLPPGFVRCPMCGMGMKSQVINTHLDNCLPRMEAKGQIAAAKTTGGSGDGSRRGMKLKFGGGQSAGKSQGHHMGAQHRPVNGPSSSGVLNSCHPRSTSSSSLVPLKPSGPPVVTVPPKIVFDVMTDRKLKERLTNLGLPVDGKKQEWADRYKAYRSFLQSKLDEGSKATQGQLLSSFLLHHKQQTEARKMVPKLPKAGAAVAVGALGYSHDELIEQTCARMKGERCVRLRGGQDGTTEGADAEEWIEQLRPELLATALLHTNGTCEEQRGDTHRELKHDAPGEEKEEAFRGDGDIREGPPLTGCYKDIPKPIIIDENGVPGVSVEEEYNLGHNQEVGRPIAYQIQQQQQQQQHRHHHLTMNDREKEEEEEEDWQPQLSQLAGLQSGFHRQWHQASREDLIASLEFLKEGGGGEEELPEEGEMGEEEVSEDFICE